MTGLPALFAILDSLLSQISLAGSLTARSMINPILIYAQNVRQVGSLILLHLSALMIVDLTDLKTLCKVSVEFTVLLNSQLTSQIQKHAWIAKA